MRENERKQTMDVDPEEKTTGISTGYEMNVLNSQETKGGSSPGVPRHMNE